MWTQIVVGLMGLGILIAGFAFYHQSVFDDGFDEATKQYQAKEENTRMQAEQRLADAIKVEQDKRTALEHAFTQINDRKKKEQDHADAEIKSLRAGLAAGSVRVSLPAAGATCPILGGDPAAAAAAAARTQPEARCDVDPATAAIIFDLAAEGDAAIRQSNALIDTYNAARGEP